MSDERSLEETILIMNTDRPNSRNNIILYYIILYYIILYYIILYYIILYYIILYYIILLFHWDVVFKTSNNFITLKLKSYKTFWEHSSFFSRYKRMTMYRVKCK